MPGSQQQPQFDSEAFTLYSQENFYTPQDLECAAKDWPRAEVEKTFEAYQAAIAVAPTTRRRLETIERAIAA